MGTHKKKWRGICPRERLTDMWSVGIPPSIRRRSRMKRKYNYYELEGSKDKEGRDREASVSKSSSKMKRKIKEGGSNDNALSASCVGLLVEGDDERALKVGKISLLTSKEGKEAQIDGKGSLENEG